jgi:hypothetical protein
MDDTSLDPEFTESANLERNQMQHKNTRKIYALGAFAQLRKYAILALLCLSAYLPVFVRLSAWNNWTPTELVFMEFDI